MGMADDLRRRAAESFQLSMRARSYLGSGAWLAMAQSWLERAQVAERRQSAPAGDLLPDAVPEISGLPNDHDKRRDDGETNGGAAR